MKLGDVIAGRSFRLLRRQRSAERVKITIMCNTKTPDLKVDLQRPSSRKKSRFKLGLTADRSSDKGDVMRKEIPFTRDAHVKVHAEGAIRRFVHTTARTRWPPEWVKNSDDEYTRLNIPKGERAIVLLFQMAAANVPNGRRLDFGGISSKVMRASRQLG